MSSIFKEIFSNALVENMPARTRKIGSRAEVMHGVCEKTASGLTKKHLTNNKHGKIVSKRKQALGRKSIKHLKALGYVAKKGHFKLFSKSMASKSKRSTRKRGGATEGADLKEAFEAMQQ